MRWLVLGLLALGGCASTVEGIKQVPVRETYGSAKPPLEVARCLKDIIPGLDIYPGEHEVSVSNRNQWGSILMNWLIKETPTGSTIELRKTNSIAPGQARATHCF